MKRRQAIAGVTVLVLAGVGGILWMQSGNTSGQRVRTARSADTPQVTELPREEAIPRAPVHSLMVYIFNAPESKLDNRYAYQFEILRTALERTRERWGEYRMEPAVPMPEKRQAFELKNVTGKLTVMYLGTTQELERTLVPVRIPVDKNLGGYMVMLIRKEDQEKFRRMNSVEDLKKFKFGLGLGWIDVDILRDDGFTVVTGSSYDGLFEMLANGRFDTFSRAAVEILDEYAQRKEKMENLMIEQTFILYYPLPMYFWFSKTAEGERLAARAREGMMSMIEDGTYDRIFMKYQKWKIDALHLKDRKVIRVKNPFLGPETPFEDKRLWFDPTAESGASSPRGEKQ